MRWNFVFSEAWIGLRRNLTMTFATILTIAIALGMLGVAWLFHKQTNAAHDYWFGKIEISVYLTKNVTQPERDQIRSQLAALPQVAHVYYENKQQAWVHFKEQFEQSAPALVKNTDPSELPESYRVKLKNPKQYAVVATAVQNLPGVDEVAAEAQVLKKLFRLLDRLESVALFVSVLVLAVAILLIFNNVRLAAFSRRRETGIMRLVGASDMYIQAPFLVEILACALVGGIIASGWLFVLKAAIIDGGLKQAFGGILAYIGTGAVWSTIPYLIIIGMVIAAVTAVGTLARYLRV